MNARTLAALLLALGTALPARAGDEPLVTSRQDGDLVEIRASAHLDADGETAWRVLTDYGRYPDFIPDLRSSRVLSRQGTTVVVEQEGSASIGPFRLPLEITFEIQEQPPRQIESRAIAGSLHSLESRYALSPEAAGTRLMYSGRVRTGFPLFSWLAQSAVEANVRRQFAALVNEIERQQASSRAAR